MKQNNGIITSSGRRLRLKKIAPWLVAVLVVGALSWYFVPQLIENNTEKQNDSAQEVRDNREEYVTQVQKLIDNKQYTEAKQKIEDNGGYKQDHTNATLYAQVVAATESPQKAAEILVQTSDGKKDEYRYYGNAANILYVDGDYQAAKAYYQKAIELSKGYQPQGEEAELGYWSDVSDYEWMIGQIDGNQ